MHVDVTRHLQLRNTWDVQGILLRLAAAHIGSVSPVIQPMWALSDLLQPLHLSLEPSLGSYGAPALSTAANQLGTCR